MKPKEDSPGKIYALLHLFGYWTLTLMIHPTLIVELRNFYGDSPMLPYLFRFHYFLQLVP